LGATSSPGWDRHSSKTKVPRLDEDSRRAQLVFLEGSLGRAILAWARRYVAQNKSWSPERDARVELRRAYAVLA